MIPEFKDCIISIYLHCLKHHTKVVNYLDLYEKIRLWIGGRMVLDRLNTYNQHSQNQIISKKHHSFRGSATCSKFGPYIYPIFVLRSDVLRESAFRTHRTTHFLSFLFFKMGVDNRNSNKENKRAAYEHTTA